MVYKQRSLEENVLVDSVLSIAPGQDALIGRDYFAKHCLRVGPSIGSITIIEELRESPRNQWLRYLGNAYGEGAEHKLMLVDKRLSGRYRFLDIRDYPEGLSFPGQD